MLFQALELAVALQLFASSMHSCYDSAGQDHKNSMRRNLIWAYLLEGALDDDRRSKVLSLIRLDLVHCKGVGLIPEEVETELRPLAARALLMFHEDHDLGAIITNRLQLDGLRKQIAQAEDKGIALTPDDMIAAF